MMRTYLYLRIPFLKNLQSNLEMTFSPKQSQNFLIMTHHKRIKLVMDFLSLIMIELEIELLKVLKNTLQLFSIGFKTFLRRKNWMRITKEKLTKN